MWEIIDSKGVIHSGAEDEMRTAFDIMTGQHENSGILPDELQRLQSDYKTEWYGDLKLIQIHSTYR